MILTTFLITLFCFDLTLVAALCPFKRSAVAEGGASDVELKNIAELLARNHGADLKQHTKKRQASVFDPVAQKISVSGTNAWIAPGPNDLWVYRALSPSILEPNR